MIKTTRFEPKAVKRGVQPQTASAKIVLRHREMTQMLLYARFEPKAVKRDVQPQTASAKIALRHREMTQMLLTQSILHFT
ncbi:hypothetical protein [Fusibacter ferrireducens]|uniref:Transposase n=1 Tax=Fusibacter ferrireducens TaxID=2785058 RepID=A0ABR9ZX26_9FIRM|nr:hypothetical protein [Fusibacter ferrireducens]MBF4694911.1 hypothetical protein [Fusibacter ferrireducens]